MKYLFALLGKIKVLTLETVYFPRQLMHMLFLKPFRNSAQFLDSKFYVIFEISERTFEKIPQKYVKCFTVHIC
jgi:hypothetical protein